jgi:hypothetical protein
MPVKKAVSAAIRKEWLRRHDEGGESAAAIARADNFDPRTVRKGIEWARKTQDIQNVRQTVWSSALTEHYHDLTDHAQSLHNVLAEEWPRKIPDHLLNHPMHEALKEHLPNARLWKNLSKWTELVTHYEKLYSELEKSIQAEFKGCGYKFSKSKEEPGLLEKSLPSSIINSISLAEQDKRNRGAGARLRQTAGESPAQKKRGLYEVRRGDYLLAYLPQKDVGKFQHDYITVLDLMDIKAQNLRIVFRDSWDLSAVIRKELALIIWRKIVPGDCRYCPV